jgi:hypothetical protein
MDGPETHFVVDFSGLCDYFSLMARSKHRDARDTHNTVSAGVLEAVGKGFLIATAGVVAGLMFGTAHLAAMGLWMLGVAAATGVGCMVGSTLVKNAGYDRCENVGRSPPAAHVRRVRTAMPAVEAAGDTVPEERWARRIAMTGRQREHATGTERGI